MTFLIEHTDFLSKIVNVGKRHVFRKPQFPHFYLAHPFYL